MDARRDGKVYLSVTTATGQGAAFMAIWSTIWRWCASCPTWTLSRRRGSSQPIPGQQHPLAYFSQERIAAQDDEDTVRMVAEHDPANAAAPTACA